MCVYAARVSVCMPLIAGVDMRLSELVQEHASECVCACGVGGETKIMVTL